MSLIRSLNAGVSAKPTTRIITAAAGLALTAGLAGGLAAPASAAVRPPPCLSFFQRCSAAPTIKIAGVDISPVWPNPTFALDWTARFSKAGTQVTDFPAFIDGVRVPEPNGPWFGGEADTLYGTYGPTGQSGNITPGRHTLTVEVIGAGGAVLATSNRYTVTVRQPVRPSLTCTFTSTSYGSEEGGGFYDFGLGIVITSSAPIDIPGGWTLIFTFSGSQVLGEDLDGLPSYNQPGYAQSGATVTYTDPYDQTLISGYELEVSYEGTSTTPATFTGVAVNGVPCPA